VIKSSVQRLQKVLTPDLLHPKWKKLVSPTDSPVKGHCYVASEVLYHMGLNTRGFVPYVVRVNGGTHWYLRNDITEQIVDPTVEQFKTIPLYEFGRRCAFLTKYPSKRAREVMRRMHFDKFDNLID
jgi:hypothetical protein